MVDLKLGAFHKILEHQIIQGMHKGTLGYLSASLKATPLMIKKTGYVNTVAYLFSRSKSSPVSEIILFVFKQWEDFLDKEGLRMDSVKAKSYYTILFKKLAYLSAMVGGKPTNATIYTSQTNGGGVSGVCEPFYKSFMKKYEVFV
jgi:hypothetical protein